VSHAAPAYPRIGVTAVVLATALGVLGVRLAWLGTAAAHDAAALHPEQPIPAPRGSLWDRRGALVATESYAYDVAAVPRDIADLTAFAQQVGPLLGQDPARLLGDLQSASPYWAILARGRSKAEAAALRDLDITGLRLERRAVRSYPLGAAASHVTGFWNPYDDRPYYGLEARYDHELRGRSGALAGNLGTDPRGFRPVRRGTDLVLTIDRQIQLAAARALDEVVRRQSAKGGTILVLEPATGAILASTSLPTFDPLAYHTVADARVFSDPATALVYEPGSAIKAITMAAALDAGVTSVGATYEDEGLIDVDGAPIYNWDHLPHGTTTMTDLLSKSLNVGAVHLALGLRAERFYAYLQAFGFGAPTGVDLEGEVGGLMPEPDAAGAWSKGVLARNSFGQAMAATPMQVAGAMAAIANDGQLVVPHLVGARRLADGSLEPVTPQPVRQVIRPEVALAVRKMLEEAVAGHVTQAAIPGHSVGGKTGTSQIPIAGGYDEEETIATFCGFLPVERPRVVILVKVDQPEGTRGQDVAAPVFRHVAEAVITALDIPADRPIDRAGDAP
jgi:cell division protein FtsI/penicillin-binding protein 2